MALMMITLAVLVMTEITIQNDESVNCDGSDIDNRSGDINGASLVVQTLWRVEQILVPSLCDPKPHAGPLVHHADGQGVQLLLAPLRGTDAIRTGTLPYISVAL
ncbi:hypothetical protein E2C01_071679 [Portunus trituberculatus]|uniref:Secreted protein n=1 Tax=Portunus trituberculatus TaxID=210409 RepID=A0A5B7HVY3_PORTR|nr:hypothetical protein [Portunus trituberculatus]